VQVSCGLGKVDVERIGSRFLLSGLAEKKGDDQLFLTVSLSCPRALKGRYGKLLYKIQ
jgi:hypothetical protein